MTREAINELKKYALGKKNTEKVEISVLQLNRVIKALEQSSYNSVKTDLKSCTEAISRQVVLDMMQMRMSGKELYKAVYELPPVNPTKTGHWIPVSEKLPEEGKEVLTCSNGGFIEIQSFEDSCADIYWENQKGDWTDIDEVIAWMPLPPSYQGE